MNKENTWRLVERFNFIPKVDPLYPRDIVMPMSIDCKDGWFNLLWRLCEDIEKNLADPENIESKEHFTVDQIKEKFAGLRFYVSASNDEIDLLIDRAEYDSYHTCEECGEPGKPREGGWYRTLCDKHAEERGQTMVLKMGWSKEFLERIGVKE